MTTLEISMNRLEVAENGSLEKRKEAYLSATLYFPRSGVAQVVSTRKLTPLTDRFVLDTAQPNPVNGRPFSWAEKTLFKEEIVGRTYLAVHVKTGKGPAEKLLEGIVRGLFGAAAGAIASPYVAVVATTAFSQAFPKEEGEMLSVAAGQLEIDPADFEKPVTLTIPLEAPADVTCEGFTVEDDKVEKRPTAVLKAGQANGLLKVTLRPV